MYHKKRLFPLFKCILFICLLASPTIHYGQISSVSKPHWMEEITANMVGQVSNPNMLLFSLSIYPMGNINPNDPEEGRWEVICRTITPNLSSFYSDSVQALQFNLLDINGGALNFSANKHIRFKKSKTKSFLQYFQKSEGNLSIGNKLMGDYGGIGNPITESSISDMILVPQAVLDFNFLGALLNEGFINDQNLYEKNEQGKSVPKNLSEEDAQIYGSPYVRAQFKLRGYISGMYVSTNKDLYYQYFETVQGINPPDWLVTVSVEASLKIKHILIRGGYSYALNANVFSGDRFFLAVGLDDALNVFQN